MRPTEIRYPLFYLNTSFLGRIFNVTFLCSLGKLSHSYYQTCHLRISLDVAWCCQETNYLEYCQKDISQETDNDVTIHK